MADNEEEFRPEVYHIPPNFREAGGVFGGRIEKRNAIELALLCGPLAYLEYHILPAFHFSIQTMLIIGMVSLFPLAFLCLFGINGESMTQIAVAFIRFKRRRRKLTYKGFTAGDTGFTATGSKYDKFMENVATVGFIKALSELTSADQNAAVDADRFDDVPPADDSSSKKKHQKRDANSRKESIADDEFTSKHGKNAGKKKKAQTAAAHKKSSTSWLISDATKEMLLRKLELGEDDDYY